MCLALSPLRADDATPDQTQAITPDPTQATPEAPAPAPAAPAPDTSVPNTQLKWPDTIELPDTATNLVPASATAAVNAVSDKTQQTLTSIDTTIKDMLDKRKSLYDDFFTQSTATDDFIQDQQIALGSLVELFNPSDKKKE